MAWRDLVDPIIKDHLEIQIKETMSNREAIEKSSNSQNAQLWIAVANLSKQFFNLNLRIKYIEKLMKELNDKMEGKVTLEEDIDVIGDDKNPKKIIKELEKELDANLKELKTLEKKKPKKKITKKKPVKKKSKKKISKKKK
ncbi:hypothetical protein K8R47_02645 [archaeon]|nr:hypothetical protein [archaeon]